MAQEDELVLANLMQGSSIIVPKIVQDVVQAELEHCLEAKHAQLVFEYIFNPSIAKKMMNVPDTKVLGKLLSLGHIAGHEYDHLIEELEQLVVSNNANNSNMQVSMSGSRLKIKKHQTTNKVVSTSAKAKAQRARSKSPNKYRSRNNSADHPHDQPISLLTTLNNFSDTPNSSISAADFYYSLSDTHSGNASMTLNKASNSSISAATSYNSHNKKQNRDASMTLKEESNTPARGRSNKRETTTRRTPLRSKSKTRTLNKTGQNIETELFHKRREERLSDLLAKVEQNFGVDGLQSEYKFRIIEEIENQLKECRDYYEKLQLLHVMKKDLNQAFQTLNGKTVRNRKEEFIQVNNKLRNYSEAIHEVTNDLISQQFKYTTGASYSFKLYFRSMKHSRTVLNVAIISMTILVVALAQFQALFNDRLVYIAESRFTFFNTSVPVEQQLTRYKISGQPSQLYADNLVPSFIYGIAQSRYSYCYSFRQNDNKDNLHFHYSDQYSYQDIMSYMLLSGVTSFVLRYSASQVGNLLTKSNLAVKEYALNSLVTLGITGGVLIFLLNQYGTPEEVYTREQLDFIKSYKSELHDNTGHNTLTRVELNIIDTEIRESLSMLDYLSNVYNTYDVSNKVFLLNVTDTIFEILYSMFGTIHYSKDKRGVVSSSFALCYFGSVVLGWGLILSVFVREILGSSQEDNFSNHPFGGVYGLDPEEYKLSRLIILKMYATSLSYIAYISRMLISGRPIPENYISLLYQTVNHGGRFLIYSFAGKHMPSGIKYLVSNWVTTIGEKLVLYELSDWITCYRYVMNSSTHLATPDKLLYKLRKLNCNDPLYEIGSTIAACTREVFLRDDRTSLISYENTQIDSKSWPYLWRLYMVILVGVDEVLKILTLSTESSRPCETQLESVLRMYSILQSSSSLEGSSKNINQMKYQLVDSLNELYILLSGTHSSNEKSLESKFDNFLRTIQIKSHSKLTIAEQIELSLPKYLDATRIKSNINVFIHRLIANDSDYDNIRKKLHSITRKALANNLLSDDGEKDDGMALYVFNGTANDRDEKIAKIYRILN